MHSHNWQPLEGGRVKCRTCYKIVDIDEGGRKKLPLSDVEEMVYHPIPGIRQVTWEELEEMLK